MTDKRFDSPMEAEAYFYNALEHFDLNAIMEVWADDKGIVCIHPMGPALEGPKDVRDSWQIICDSGQQLSFKVNSIIYEQTDQMAFHIVREEISMAGEQPKEAVITATNVYRQTDNGWRLVLHHASPSPADNNVPVELEEEVTLH